MCLLIFWDPAYQLWKVLIYGNSIRDIHIVSYAARCNLTRRVIPSILCVCCIHEEVDNHILILSAQEEGGDGDDNEETEETASEENSELVGQVGEILEDFDAGKKNKKKAISAIVALGEDVDADAVTELVEGFEDDADADIDDVAKKIADVVSGVEVESAEEEEDEKPAKKSPKKDSKKAPKEELVDVDDLEVGDRVSVYWDDENKDWFDGKVKSIKKGKVVIAYDDDTEEPIDPEVHTKIKRLAE